MQDINLTTLPPLSLYIHIPWCIKKCPYCDFNSHQKRYDFVEDEYIDSLLKDLELSLPSIWGRQINSIFIGGGTPSLFSGESIKKLLNNVRALVRLSPFAEITIEANPATVETEFLDEYSQCGINRISIGVQSFNTAHLKSLGRIHDEEQSYNAINRAKKYFNNINIDLMFGLPNQSMKDLEEDVFIGKSFDCQHLSYYNLTIEPNTLFAKTPPPNLPSNDLCYDMQEYIIEQLKNAKYLRYEISAYAKDGNQSKHNLNYWLFGDYLGIGCGSHSKISFNDDIIRQVRQKNPESYMKDVFENKHIIEHKSVSNSEVVFEFMLNSLRLINGFETNLFTQRTGLSLNNILHKLQMAKQNKLLDLDFNKIKPTKLGINFLNDLLINFLSD
jgi:putative oxygen-independent coproporphyrinogen III oxidase